MISGQPDWSALSSQNERLVDTTDELAGRHTGDHGTPGPGGAEPAGSVSSSGEAGSLPQARPGVPGRMLHLRRRRGPMHRHHGLRGSAA